MRRTCYSGNLIVVFFILLCSLQICSLSCVKAAADEKNTKTDKEQILKVMPISSILIPIAEIVSGETPTLEAMEKHFGMKATEETNAKNNFRLIRLNIPGYEIRISNDKTRQVIDSVTCPPSFRVTVHPNNDYNSQYLQFKEVEAILGKWVLLGESKTSYVYFLYKNARTGKLIEISVHLLHSPEYREGMVLCILMLSDKASDFILEKFR